MKIRRPNRLKEYDYSGEGAYFITLCVKERKNLLRHPVGATIGRPQVTQLPVCSCAKNQGGRAMLAPTRKIEN